MDSDVRMVEVPGGDVWARSVGESRRGRYPLIAIHGGPGGVHGPLINLAALGAERPVILYDQLGCGKSGRPKDESLWTVERAVAELRAVAAAFQVDRAHILGHSWGALVAAEHAAAGGGVEPVSVVLSGPLLSTKRWVADCLLRIEAFEEPYRSHLLAHMAGEDVPADDLSVAEFRFTERHNIGYDPKKNALFIGGNEAIYGAMWGASEYKPAGTLRDHDATPRLGRIRAPVLLTCGSEDYVRPETLAMFAKLFPNAQTHVFEGVGHHPLLDTPDATLAVWGAFLRTQDGASAGGAEAKEE